MAKSPLMKLRDQADRIAGSTCRARGVCEAAGLDTLGCKGALQWCHIVERSNLGIRWEMDNCLCMCQAHHLLFTYRPMRWLLFVMANFPRQWTFVKEHINERFDGDYPALIARLQGEA